MKQALRRAGVALVLFSFLAGASQAQERTFLGFARIFTNDVIGDGHDRWRTGAYGVSAIRGSDWDGALPTGLGEVMEYRFRGETIAPASLIRPDPDDRLYAGILSAGAHGHYALGPLEVAAGLDLVMMGEQTGIRHLQEQIHQLLSIESARVKNHQVENGVYLHGTVELAHEFGSADLRFRPFVELQYGVENLARIGADLTIGGYGAGGLRVRDSTTGHRMTAIDSPTDHGFSFLLGGDVAMVDGSVLLPADRGYQVEDRRHRLRAGVNFAFGTNNVFYGITYLSEEFVGQPDGQVVGSLSVGISF